MLKKHWGKITALLLLVFGKLKWVLALFKIGKFATLATMFVSVWVYALFYGWKFAVALVYLLFVHEMGHLMAAKKKGIKTSPAVFIPFLGALIGMKEKPKDAQTEAFVAYGGPLFGFLSFLPAIPLYYLTNNPFWGMVITVGAMLNLFNLFPVSPLDGGRIVSVLSSKVWLIGLLILIPILFISPDPIIFLIFIFGIITWFNRLSETKRLKKLNVRKSWMDNEREEMAVLKQGLENTWEPSEKVVLLNDTIYAMDQRMKDLQLWKTNSKEEKLHKEFQMDSLKFKVGVVQSYWLNNDAFEMALQQLDQALEKIQTEIKGLHSYYDTPIAMKWKWLALYIGLAIILSLGLVYGMNIMEMNPPTLN